MSSRTCSPLIFDNRSISFRRMTRSFVKVRRTINSLAVLLEGSLYTVLYIIYIERIRSTVIYKLEFIVFSWSSIIFMSAMVTDACRLYITFICRGVQHSLLHCDSRTITFYGSTPIQCQYYDCTKFVFIFHVYFLTPISTVSFMSVLASRLFYIYTPIYYNR